jgi:SAM-dependent methyltransferase
VSKGVAYERLAREQHQIWERIASFWDAQLPPHPAIFPTLDLIDVQQGTRLLDIGCGNGRFARHAASLGASVVAVDVSRSFIDIARGYGSDGIDYRVVDATDERSLLSLGEEAFDVAVANMVLMNLATIEPLARAAARALKPGGALVACVPHPCFPWVFTVDVKDDTKKRTVLIRLFRLIDGIAALLPKRLVQRLAAIVVPMLRSLRRRGYLTAVPRRMSAPGQPVPHYNFHRPLQELLRPFLATGFVLDALSEPAEGMDGSAPVDPEIPNVLIFRLRRSA